MSTEAERYVETFRWDRLKQFQRAALLAFMGVGRHELRGVKNKSDALNRLKLEATANPERFHQGVDAVVLGKTPSNLPTDVAKDVELRVLSVLKDFKSDEVGEAAERRVSELLVGLREDLEKSAKKAVSMAAENYRPIVIKDGGKIRKVKGVLPVEFPRMVELASQRIPILLVGPSGCGKTYLSEKLAKALGLEYADQSCSEGMSESIFNGRLLPIGKGGAFEHVASPWMITYENGGVFLLDEVDAGDSNLMTYPNKAVANDFYTVEQRWKKPVVRKHKDFVLIAAANTFGTGANAIYVGRNQLDAATLDRFKVGTIYMDYSREVEQSLADDDLCQWAWAIRAKITEHGLHRIMSTRVIKDLSTMTQAYGWTKKEWEAAYFSGWSEAEQKLVS